MKTKAIRTATIVVLLAVSLILPVQAGPPAQGPSPQEVFDDLNTQANGTLKVRWDPTTGIPRFLGGPIASASIAVGDTPSPENIARAFFRRYSALYRMTDPDTELVLVRNRRDSRGLDHLRFQQACRGVEVWGGEFDVHLQNGQITSIGSHYYPDIHLDTTPRITLDEAIAVAQTDLGAQESKLSTERTRLVIFQIGGQPYLTWRVQIFSWEPLGEWIYYVDAKIGDILRKLNELPDARNRFTYTANHGTSLPGSLQRSEGQGPVSDADVNYAHDYAGTVYDYYWNTHGRDSWDDSGSSIVSTVHYSNNYNNAFWTSTYNQVVYGDGDGVTFAPFDQALDVVAHELTHAVTNDEAGLVYEFQSGALNESYSDFFGVMVDRDDWQCAEAIYTPAIPGDAGRDMQTPVLYGQPGHMIEYVDLPLDIDNGGVHVNSGIPNRVGYCVATSIGYDKAERIYYDTLVNRLLSTDDFMDARDKTIASCNSLYGSGSNTCRMVQNCFASVGLGSSSSLVGLTNKTYLPVAMENYGLTCSQVTWLKNGGFENGDRYWPSGGVWITNAASTRKHSGSWTAWFGGYDDAYDVALQAPRVPANATSVTWSAWVYMTSNEGTGAVYDTLDLLVQDAYDHTLVTQRIADNSSSYSRGRWFKRTFTWSSPSWRGQRVRFVILADTDFVLSTSFFVDDVSLFIDCGGGMP
jgi:bacillolysin